jgi:hypothetical protein
MSSGPYCGVVTKFPIRASNLELTARRNGGYLEFKTAFACKKTR